MEINLAKASKIAGAIAGTIVAVGVIYTSSISAFDSAHKDYVTVGELAKVFESQDEKELKKFIRRLEWQVNNGGLTPQQQWELSDAYDELEDMQE